ncbi:uncharacterized protein VDAG_04893 [Verticillium dahliae VdLs.17]|uniref:Uncharacterized protein n=1 Tax=Verticillium dahliae (strain VdLs.17 / ATCC MYA-4575 / FGSC 10137) TaxID=498257 RepID=G2X3A8_VERDV|nr:uncharacterized protein VDAG_04893 [Verticillium dahliae VdLs.17]EGY23455.1 hypothetical protein VDAG_04893 [Verticillium dahliae VdLs.17]KAH6708538.1 hypothetical protein EV126DRAFT_438829 [Verticillium dahliae]
MESQPSPELSSTAIADLAMDMELGSPGLAHSVVRKRSCRLHMSPMLYDGMVELTSPVIGNNSAIIFVKCLRGSDLHWGANGHKKRMPGETAKVRSASQLAYEADQWQVHAPWGA